MFKTILPVFELLSPLNDTFLSCSRRCFELRIFSLFLYYNELAKIGICFLSCSRRCPEGTFPEGIPDLTSAVFPAPLDAQPETAD